MKYVLYICLLIVGSIYSCKSTHTSRVVPKGNTTEIKEKKYNSRQNFTTKYNILFNAKNMLGNEAEAIFNNHKKNYQIRQQVFDEPLAQGESHQLMDSLIQKAYKIINDKQESRYVNEAYFILGKANYFKGSYHTAIEFFNNLIRSSIPTSSEYQAPSYAWKSRALLQIGKTQQAKLAIDSAFVFLDENKETRTLVNATIAHYHLRVGDVAAAIPYLEYALESNKNSLDKYRWTFLLAQLYKESGNKEKAYQHFKQIARSNVPYDMSFEADLQAAFLEGDNADDIEQKVKPLLRMLKEGKNDGYQDQILYQIGEVYYTNNQHDKAIAYFNKALREANRNPYQSVESYLTLADHYFENKQYYTAQLYYDSVATILPQDYTDVTNLRRKLAYMNDIAQRYQVVSKLDTLIYYASLNPDELDKILVLNAMPEIAMQKSAIDKKQQSKSSRNKKNPIARIQFDQQFSLPNTQNNIPMGVQSAGAFYFNNPDELLLGQSAFKRRWGNRQLADNWRYESGMALASDMAIKKIDSLADDPVLEFDEDQYITSYKNRYINEIPKSKDEFEQAHKTIHDNLISIGNMYRDYTQDHSSAIVVYEDFLKRYPTSDQCPAIYYSLYRMYADLDIEKSRFYLSTLIQLYPESVHAKVGQDPAYMDKINRDKKLLDRIFEKLFNLYTKGDHAAVIREADKDLKERIENTALVAQVEYLRALAIGRIGRVEDFQEALKSIVDKHPQNSLVTPLALENLTFIEQNPSLFVNRVNALQDINSKRIPFIGEPDMTAWPSLNINGDYRSSVALVQPLPKSVEEKPIEKLVNVEKDKILVQVKDSLKAEIIAELEKVKNEVAVAKVDEGKKEEIVTKVDEIKKQESPRIVTIDDKLAGKNQSALSGSVNTKVNMQTSNIAFINSQIDFGPNDFRDKELFPDTAEYYFIINVLDPKVNMAPSRYGIGQFNRTRYAQSNLNHTIRVINGENQLILIESFKTFDEVKAYEKQISALMAEIMKVPVEIYNTFVITKDTLPLLTDGVEIKKYYQNYTEQ